MVKIDCKGYAEDILDRVGKIPNKGNLMIVTAGHDPASEAYIRGKLKDAERCGIRAARCVVKNQDELEAAVRFDDLVNFSGIIIQLPLPKGFDEDWCVNFVDTEKDVDGFKSGSPFTPCTPEGIMWILRKEIGDLTGKTALVIGRGKLVGEPIAKLLLKANCTVTIAHSKTRGLEEMLKSFDIIICAAGVPKLVDLAKCKAEIVIDAGISKYEGKLCGDSYNLEDTGEGMKVACMPNGIGLITRAVLMAHVARMEV